MALPFSLFNWPVGVVSFVMSRQRKMQVFLSYRREDSSEIAGHIFDGLSVRLGADRVFMDVDGIPLGVDFKESLTNRLSRCAACLAVVGPRWVDCRDASGARRLDDPSDVLRIELESALTARLPVIPLLVSGATLPAERDLPTSLAPLARRQGMVIRPQPDFKADMHILADRVREHFGS